MPEDTATIESPSKELDLLVRSAVEKISQGSITLVDLLKTLAPKPAQPAQPRKLPIPAKITDAERAAIREVEDVFGKVVPENRREVQPVEVTALLKEKSVLDTLKKMAEKRVGNIRTTIFNHLDVQAETESDFDPETISKDKDGFYVRAGEAQGTEGDERFTRETAEKAPTLIEARLLALAKDDDFPDFTHSDYLSMTTQVRVMDESKVLLALKKNPSLVMAIARATEPGTRTASFHVR